MSRGVHAIRRFACAGALAVAILPALPGTARAQDPRVSEATAHFQRAISLYYETDYTAALVEFNRAYELAPHVNLLYNIGQCEFQLQHYADALSTFERYLREGGSSHRDEVQASVATLHSRVGRVRLTSNTPGATVQVDDREVGRTPLADPIVVAVGRRKIALLRAEGPSIVKWIDVPSGDEVPLALDFEASAPTPASTGATPEPAADVRETSRRFPVVPWVATGVLAAGTAVTGVLALQSASQLSTARKAFPADPQDVQHKASTTTALSITTDVLGAATIVLGGLSVYWTLSRRQTAAVRVGLSPTGMRVVGSF